MSWQNEALARIVVAPEEKRDEFGRLLATTHHIYIVNHLDPDVDSTFSTFCWLEDWGIRIDDPRIHYKFVKAGRRYTGPTEEGSLVLHFDTGLLYDGLYNFDHHQDETIPSATYLVVRSSPKLSRDWAIGYICNTANKVDTSGKLCDKPSEECYTMKDKMNQELRIWNRTTPGYSRLRVAHIDNGPEDVVRLLSTMETCYGEMSPEAKLKTGMYMLKAWYNQRVTIPSKAKALLKSDETKVGFSNGLTYYVVAETNMVPTTLRAQARRLDRGNPVDVLIVRYVDGDDISFGVNLTEPENVDGMKELLAKICELDPDIDPKNQDQIFLHSSTFVLYLYKLDVVNWETLVELTKDTLRRKETAE